ncbi:uncharacterized protein LOC143536795 [Bidens hawaiensis]|uniref:uncharacterized protein LOC143536795 n=1 Tax=Bidens hawaiensis TaxID=980011 RepID=UPI00404B87BC
MLSSNLNLSVICTNKNIAPTLSFYHFVECDRLCLKTAHLDARVFPGLVFIRPFRGLKLHAAFHRDPNLDKASNFSKSRDQLISSNEPNNFVIEIRSDKDKNEIERRRKIGFANKGKVPWNKGKKHTPETRELISQRTKEALKDPKVRKKMSECPRALSEQTKAKIRITITQQWKERLKIKRSSERFISKWAESIAKAAKKGGPDQQELDWDSYDKIEKEIALQQMQRSADVAKAKEMAQIRAEKRARAKAEKVKLTLKKRVAKVKGLAKKKSKEEKQELAAAEDLKLKERLTKIHKKKSINDQLSSQSQRDWERLDLDFWKRGARKEDISLADQIRDVKNKKAEIFIRSAVTITTPNNNLSSETGY